MRQADLPTPAEVLADANEELRVIYGLLGDTGQTLKSDTREPWTEVQRRRKPAMFDAIRVAKAAINEARNA